MPTTEQLAASNLYRDLMIEIRSRIHVIDTATMNQIPVAPPFVREFCFLQIRMMCELIALGCLAAHGDLKGSKKSKLDRLWAADKIIEELESLHQDFFPIAVIKTKVATGYHIEPKNPQPLTKQDMLKLYYKCGDVLHKGSTKKILAAKQPVVVHYPEITSIAQKFRDLISDHAIFMLGGQQSFLCNIFPEGTSETVTVAIAERP
jgi:hypothetical protein